MAEPASFTYDVFISFRGKDTRYGFIGNLYKALRERGIHTFIDDKGLHKGKEIFTTVVKAIKGSRIAIIVLSKNYAASSFCLQELAEILECFKKRKDRLVFPVFYDVKPSDVLKGRGIYGEALAKHEERFNDDKEKVNKWRMALHQAANISGFPFKHGEDYESELIEKIVREVSRKIAPVRVPVHIADYPVGLESRVDKVKSLLNDESDEVVHMVGIYGIGGIGKTTIARAVYNLISDEFEGLCFLEGVRETTNKYGLVHLQEVVLSEMLEDGYIKIQYVNQGISIIKHRLHWKKILLVLDDVDHIEQLEAIVGALDWFGPGSRVIITTRNKHLLAVHGVKSTYGVEELSEEEALDLLKWKAFKTDKVDPSYRAVLKRAVTYASRLPLALQVLGSDLLGKSIDEWNDALDKYEKIPNEVIQEALKISFDSLEEVEKSIFLDIACFFNGHKLADVEDILRAHYGFFENYSIRMLIERSLIKIDDGLVTLHGLIQRMGREIVRQESPSEPGKRSRLWFYKDVVQVLEENTGSSKIESLFLDFPKDEIHLNGPKGEDVYWDGDAFKKMENLRVLVIRSGRFNKGPTHLPHSLRVLKWADYPPTSLPDDFHPEKLVMLELPVICSTISKPIQGLQGFICLTVLNFSYCKWITHIFDVSGLPNLKELRFSCCENLIQIHDSVGSLDKLRILDASHCKKLRSFPPIRSPSLEHLNLACCGNLIQIHDSVGSLDKLRTLDAVKGLAAQRTFAVKRRLEDVQGKTSERLSEDELYPTTIQNEGPFIKRSCKGDDVKLEAVSSYKSETEDVKQGAVSSCETETETEDSSSNTTVSDSDDPSGKVYSKITHAPLHIVDYPIGLQSRVLKVNSLLNVGSNNVVHMVGIHGIGGIGKTSIARAVYNSINDRFEGSCFLDNVRENSTKYSLVHLQHMLLSEVVGDKDINLRHVNEGISIIKHRLRRRKILLVLDDVNKIEQLQAIVGAPDWFGPGSRVIITTENKHLLVRHGVESTYAVEGLSEEAALDLLRWSAFKANKVDPSYEYALKRAVTYAPRLPLALEVMGSYLFGKSIDSWNYALDQYDYEQIPDKRIQKILQVSFDSLHEKEKAIFLDIACFFNGNKLADIEDILSAHHGISMKYSIEMLIEKSLVRIDDGLVILHDLIQDMGREIVKQESPNEPGKRRRLWFHEDVVKVLKTNTGSSTIESLVLDFPKDDLHWNGPDGEEEYWDGEAFKNMKNLRTLIIRNCRFPTGPTHLPNSLKVLKWWKYPSSSLPSDFDPKELAILELPDSCVMWCEPIQRFRYLTVLDFGYCESITHIPDVSGLPNLEKLSVKHCENLNEIHKSVGFLDKLRILDAVCCVKLGTFPPIRLTSLELLNLSHCLALERFPEISGKMENITELHVVGSPIKELPFSIRNLTRLRKLELQFCGMVQLPSSITMMLELSMVRVSRCEGLCLSRLDQDGEMVSSNAECLILSYCNISNEFFPRGLTWFANVKDLNLSGNNITIFPTCFKECRFLRDLTLDDCRLLQEISGIPWNLETLSANGCTSLKDLDLPKECHFLRELILDDCVYLQEIRGVPPNLNNFSVKNCTFLTSWCTSTFLNQERVEAGNKVFVLPGSKVPEWFTHCTRGASISFWFRNKFPVISLCLVIGLVNEHPVMVKFSPKYPSMAINGPLIGRKAMSSG